MSAPLARRQQLIEALMQHEGLRLSAYRDTVGKLTIGYGHNLDAKPLSWLRPNEPIPLWLAVAILNRDIDDTISSLDHFLPWWRGLDDVRQQVLCEMAFNMGVDANHADGLDSFINTLQAVREARWDAASDGMLNSKWARQVGSDRSTHLSYMMLTGRP